MHFPNYTFPNPLITKQRKIKLTLWDSDLGSSVEGERRQGKHFQNIWKRSDPDLHWSNSPLLKYKLKNSYCFNADIFSLALLIVVFLHSNKKFWQRKGSFLFF